MTHSEIDGLHLAGREPIKLVGILMRPAAMGSRSVGRGPQTITKLITLWQVVNIAIENTP